MSNLMDLLQGQLNDNILETLSQSAGIGDKNKTADATNAIFSFLTNAVMKNISSPDGLDSFSTALDNDHDGSILDNLGGILSSGVLSNNRSTNGAGILGHLLGSKQNTAIDMISRAFGLDKSTVGSLMIKLAPMLMATIGKAKKQNNYSNNDLSDLVRSSVEKHNTTNKPGANLITKILDKDGDGSVMDDLLSMGAKSILGGLFK